MNLISNAKDIGGLKTTFHRLPMYESRLSQGSWIHHLLLVYPSASKSRPRNPLFFAHALDAEQRTIDAPEEMRHAAADHALHLAGRCIVAG